MATALQHRTIQLGPSTITAIVDVTTPWPILPVNGDVWDKVRESYPSSFYNAETLLGRVHCYLIQQAERTILVDTGLGKAPAPTQPLSSQQLEAQLALLGVDPAAIDTVFLTHLHVDHVGLNTHYVDGTLQARFPNARYLAHQAEKGLIAFMQQHSPERAGYLQDQVLWLEAQGRLEFFDADFELAEGITTWFTPGHSPGHTALVIDHGTGERVLLAGDIFFNPIQMFEPSFATGLDVDSDQAHATRLAVLGQVSDGKTLVAPCHFPTPSFGYVVPEGAAYRWLPIEDELSRG
ncbi:MBL fold metallo-hydrolase [Herpetosiphon giganteus]|uniref:MBL fold metallo-hydrolase n=1 Tax=Herpetosiphon giganteus TaxID=2029754 RepID=UPI00195E1C63|nr:MBL fold metallo-hydrolase [Herpetosiphon giganteus]MBM7846070.1 glyoxylase-like metal-dependent hydrolase (beta-lactamase superfamily II) [Herpetosiphon giganteus]